jgi:hypothetical protein
MALSTIFAIREDGTLWRFELGGGMDQVGTEAGWTWIDAGYEGIVGIRAGRLYYTGSINPEEVGTTDDWTSATIVQSPQPGDGYCAIRSPGTLWCGDSNTDPEQIGTDADWVEVELGGKSRCARKVDASVWCWGEDVGTYGFFPLSDYAAPPVEVAAFADDIALGINHNCLLQGGDVSCWGFGMYGQLGTGDAFVDTPVLVP